MNEPMTDRAEVIFQEDMEACVDDFQVSSSEVVVKRHGSDLDQAPFKGVFSRRTLAAGCLMMASDLIALQTERMTAKMPGQFIIRLPFQTGDIQIGGKQMQPVTLQPNKALKVAMSSDIQLDGEFVAGQRYTDFFVHVSPDAMIDDELSERIVQAIDRDQFDLIDVDPDLSRRALKVAQAETDDCVQGLLAESCALELLAVSLSNGPESESPAVRLNARDRQRLKQVRDCLTDEPANDHRLVNLARDAGISVTSLKTKFQAAYGQSVTEFLRNTRLDRAKFGLLSEGWTVTEAAYRVGYRHQSSFSAAFHRKFGQWPSKIR